MRIFRGIIGIALALIMTFSFAGCLQKNPVAEPLSAEPLPGITDTYEHPLRPHFELASCRKLEGEVAVVLLFVDDNESNWSKKEIKKFTDEHILVALDYLEAQAHEYGVELDFKIESYSTPTSGYDMEYDGKVNENLFNGGSTKDVIDQMAVSMGLESNWELYSYFKSKYPEDDIVFLSFLDKPGRSYARNVISKGYIAYAEHCVIFSDSYGSSASDIRIYGSRASTIAHEFLHLFGAEDYYEPYKRESLANTYYPDDIMLWQYDDINENTIGSYTAFSIGWTNKPPEVCYNQDWWE